MRSYCHGLTAEGRPGWLAAAMFSLALAAAPLARAHELTASAAARPADAEPLFPAPPLPPLDDFRLPAQMPARPESAAIDDDDHQLWLLSTRSLPHGSRASGQSSPSVRRFQPGLGWSDAPLEELLSADSPRHVTSVLVHGNDTDSKLAIAKGFEVYRTLVRKSPADQRVRLIVWSWPSDHIRGPFREDARIKAQRTNIEAYYLAKFLERHSGARPISLVGYSFGARIITGALHLFGGGTLEGRRLARHGQTPRPPIHAVLMAAALDRDWLLPGRQHGRALSVVERMVVLVNPQDRVLKWYRFLSPGEQALGSTGLADDQRLGADRKKLVHVDVAHAVGNKHGWPSYIGSREIVERLHHETLVEPARKSSSRSQAGGS